MEQTSISNLNTKSTVDDNDYLVIDDLSSTNKVKITTVKDSVNDSALEYVMSQCLTPNIITDGNMSVEYYKLNNNHILAFIRYTYNHSASTWTAEGGLYYKGLNLILPAELTNAFASTPWLVSANVVWPSGYGLQYVAGSITTTTIRGWLFSDKAEMAAATAYCNFILYA